MFYQRATEAWGGRGDSALSTWPLRNFTILHNATVPRNALFLLDVILWLTWTKKLIGSIIESVMVRWNETALNLWVQFIFEWNDPIAINACGKERKEKKTGEIKDAAYGVAWDAESHCNVCKCHLSGIHFPSWPHPHATRDTRVLLEFTRFCRAPFEENVARDNALSNFRKIESRVRLNLERNNCCE